MPSRSSLRGALPTPRSRLLAPVRGRTYRRGLYLLLSFPLGITYFVVLLIGLVTGAATLIVLIGFPLLLSVLVLVRGLGWAERRLVDGLLDVDVPGPEYAFLEGGFRERLVGLVGDTCTWTELVYLFSMFGFGMGSFVFLVTSLTTSLTILATPLYYDRAPGRVGVFPGAPIELTQSLYVPWGDLLVGAEFGVTVSRWAVDSLPDALLMSAVGVVLLWVTLNLIDGIGWLWGQYARLLLSGERQPVAWLSRRLG